MRFSQLVSPQPKDGARQAALVIHALPSLDQEWLLARLSAPEQGHLRKLLQELSTLAIPSDQRLLTEVLASSPISANRTPARASPPTVSEIETAPSVAPLSDVEFFMQLDAFRLSALIAVLRAEPALLVARCLQLRSWPWQQDLLDHLNPVQLRQVQDLLEKPLAPPASATLSTALLQQLRLRCERNLVRSAPTSTTARLDTTASDQPGPRWLHDWSKRLRGVRT